jgi:predicted DNA-binding protein
VKNTQVNIRLSQVMLKGVAALSKKQGRHTHELIREAINDFLKKHEAELLSVPDTGDFFMDATGLRG